MRKGKINKLYITIIFSLLAAIAIAALILLTDNNIKVDYDLLTIENDVASININAKSNNIFKHKLFICIDDNPETDENTFWQDYDPKTIYEIDRINKYIHIKDNKGHTNSALEIKAQTYALDINNSFYPAYPLNDEIVLDISIFGVGKDNLVISSSNENVVKVSDNKLLTVGIGTSNINIKSNDISKDIQIEVTDLYTIEDYDSDNKPFLTTTICTNEQNQMLDKVLEMKIQEAGYKTRAGVVEAARFLSLQFPYKLAYFSESGRLDTTVSSSRCDGEGRYYHKGLYLSESKYDEIVASRFGPKYWGLFFRQDESDDHSLDEYYLSGGLTTSDIGTTKYLSKRPNGFDCSGFVAWCYYNGGFDFGDMGAGGYDVYGMGQLGQRVRITKELLESDQIKAGDLVGLPGHIGIVIGVEDDYIWIADTLITGLKVKKYERNVESFKALGDDAFQYFLLMDDEYLQDGNYTKMWN